MFWLSCTATGAPRSSASWSFIASRPTPAALRRAPSISPGGLFGDRPARLGHRRALGSGLASGSGLATSGLVSVLACVSDLACSVLATGLGAGGSRCSSTSLASRGGSSTGAARSSFGRGISSSTMQTIAQSASTLRRMRLKRASSSGEIAHGSTEARNEMAAASSDGRPREALRNSRCGTARALMPCSPSADRERHVAEVRARRGVHHLAQQAVRDVLVAHDRDGLVLRLVLLAQHGARWPAGRARPSAARSGRPAWPSPRPPSPPCGRRPGCRWR